MTRTQPLSPSQTDRKDQIIFPKGEFWSDEPTWESNLHLTQIILLIKCLEWLWQDREDYFATWNLTIYYSPNQKKSEYFRGLDFFVVFRNNQKPKPEKLGSMARRGKISQCDYRNPLLKVPLRLIDKKRKKFIKIPYRTPDYFWFDPYSLELEGHTLIRGKYQPIQPNQQGWLWSEELGLYLGIYADKLCYFSPKGELVPTPVEAAILERQSKKSERQQKQLAPPKVEQLTARLGELGINPEKTLWGRSTRWSVRLSNCLHPHLSSGKSKLTFFDNFRSQGTQT